MTYTQQEQLRNQSAAAIISGRFDADQVLLPYQRRWIADDAQLKIAEKSRRTGLTWAEAADAALNGSLSASAGGSDTFYVGTTKDMAREFIDACAMWAKAYGLAASDTGEEVLNDDDKDIWSTLSTLPAVSKSRRCPPTRRTCVVCRATSSLMKPVSRKTLLRYSKRHWRSPCGGKSPSYLHPQRY